MKPTQVNRVKINDIYADIASLSYLDKLKLVDWVLHNLDKPDPEIVMMWENEAAMRLMNYEQGLILPSPSPTIEHQLKLLQAKELAIAYHQASLEIDHDWDVTIGDGLSDEAW